jgi:ABC-type Fe3+/spermidine/putrescine transport system ATPase subunit
VILSSGGLLPGVSLKVESSQQNIVVQLKGIVKNFGKLEAVKKIDLNIEQSSLVTLLGPSGCGKTTILRMIAGLEHPTRGEIYINGKVVNDIPIHKRNLGMIFQNYALFPHKSIFDNVAFGLKYRNVSKTDIREKVRKALEMVRLPDVGNRYPSQLSGGQQQRIALARAIVIEPDVLLMDEPLSALDENLREDMRREIDNIQQMLGVTTIFVTHDQREALSMSDKIVVLNDGILQQEGPPEDVYNYPCNRFVADFLGSSNFFLGKVLSRENGHHKVRLESGHEFLSTHPSEWEEGDKIELVIRAQKFYVYAEKEAPKETHGNPFHGVIKDRSYMGGEVSYFIDLEGGLSIHVISIVNIRALKIGDKVVVDVSPRHCGLLPG